MSTDSSVEELLTQTLKRAGELAVPEGLLLPFELDAPIPEINEGPSVRTRGRSARSWWIAVGSIAALVLVAVGLVALLRSSPSITVERTQLSAARGQQLLCGDPGCVPTLHDTTGLPSQSGVENASPAYGAFQTIPSRLPVSTWVVATNGHLVRVIKASTRAAYSTRRSKSGIVYLSAGNGKYYRFTTPGQGPLRVVSHAVDSVTLKASDGKSYVLNLQTSELLPLS